MWISKKKGYLQDWITQVWVKTTGRRFDPEKDTWLPGPVGSTAIIRDQFIHDIAAKEQLEINSDLPEAGLMESFNDLGLSDAEKLLIDKRVVHFYERTACYQFEVWSAWCGVFKPFGWLLAVIFSRRLQQLNLPLGAMDAAKGIQSNIIKLVDRETKNTVWTIWYRILKSTNHVIYAGVYTTCNIPDRPGKFLKVIFPLPNGNASVIMRKEILPDGSLKLSSDGKKFGDNGFYFTLTDHKGKYWARFVRSMHEWIRVYVDKENVLRADHHLHFYGMPFLRLHYKMTPKNKSA